MFTGITEETGTITNVSKLNNGALLTVACKKVLEDTRLGDSIAINGACETVTDITVSSFSVFASYETLQLTTLGSMKNGTKVNLERALRLSDRLGGHIVSGHVDGKGKLISSEKIGDAYKMTFSLDECLMRQVVKKGSITVNGISLTVAEITDTGFSCAVIPHTYVNTSLKDLYTNSDVNIETDIIGKYVEKFLLPTDNETTSNKSDINTSFLERNGFL